MSARVADVMTKDVVAVRASASFKEIAARLREQRVSALPVLDADNRVIGVVSEADLLAKEASPGPPPGLVRLAWMLKERSKATGVTAAEVMTKPAVTIREDATVGDAARLMQSRRVKHLPVVDDGRLRGIISRADVLSVFERPDAEIRDEVVKGIIVEEFGLDPELLAVTVRSGIVTVTGSVDRRADALGLLGAARHAEGVVGVRDRLSYPAVG